MIKIFYLFQFGQSQRIMVFDFELHKAHVGWVGELRDDTKSWEKSGTKKRRVMFTEKNKPSLRWSVRWQRKVEDLKRVWTLTMVFASAM